MHKLGDMNLALKVAKPLQDNSVPVWAREMTAVVHEKRGEMEEVVLAGPTCDSIDVIAEDVPLPLLKVGDLVVGGAMGAYTWASASEFNFFPKATVVSVNQVPGDLGTVLEF